VTVSTVLNAAALLPKMSRPAAAVNHYLIPTTPMSQTTHLWRAALNAIQPAAESSSRRGQHLCKQTAS
jgi:hypothetical protein